MLFRVSPKESKEELFGREEDLEKLPKAFKSRSPFILLLGIRRIGKTSLLKVALKKSELP